MADQPFRPMRSNQSATSFPIGENQEESIKATQPTFQRQQSKSTQKKESVLPEWDLLPPRTIVRRKGL